MKNKKKLLISLSSLTLALSPLTALAVSCTEDESIVTKHQWVFSYNTPYSAKGFPYDESNGYGGFVTPKQAYYTLPLSRLQGLSQPEIDVYGVKEGKNVPEIKKLIVKPTFVKRKLEAAKAIILTLKDGTVKIYDNDKADIYPEPDLEVMDQLDNVTKKGYRNISSNVTSNDPRSINNISFNHDLTNAKEMQFVIRDNVKYVDKNGNETKYNVTPKDFYYSWLRTFLLTTLERRNNGGSEALDNFVNGNLLETGSNYFTNTVSYPNSYLFSFIGIDYNSFADENKFLKTLDSSITSNLGVDPNTKAVTIAGVENADFYDFTTLFNSLIINDLTFMPAPSEYIDDVNNKIVNIINSYKQDNPNVDLSQLSAEIEKSDPKYSQQQEALKKLGDYAISKGLNEIYTYNSKNLTETPELLGKFLALLSQIDQNSKTFKSGTYWYGISIDNTLFAGPYYPKGFSNLKETFAKNPYFYDKSFVNAKDTINEVELSFVTRPINALDFQTRQFNQYNVGDLSRLSFSSLSTSQKTSIISKNSKETGLRYSQVFNEKTPYYRRAPLAFAYENENGSEYYSFSDTYSLLNWGVNKEDLGKGLANPSTFIDGLGLSFRTILNAAINYAYLAETESNSLATAFVGNVAIDSLLGGRDQDESPYKKPLDVLDRINVLYAIDADGNKINFGTNENPIYEVSMKENQLFALNQKNTEDKLKSKYFDRLQKEMQKVLDKFDKLYPKYAGQDFVFDLYYFYTNPSENIKRSGTFLEEIINKLNSRLKPKFSYGDVSTPAAYKRYFDLNIRGANGTNRVAWGVDYTTSIGSSFDGLSWNGELIPTLTYIYANRENPTLKNAFPQLVNASVELHNYATRNNPHWDVPFDELYKVAGQILIGDASVFVKNKFTLNSKNNKYELATKTTSDNKTTEVLREPSEAAQAIDPFTFSAKFWLQYSKELTNEELIKLIKEVATYLGYDYFAANKRAINPFTEYLVNPGYIITVIPGQDQEYISDWRIATKNDKENNNEVQNNSAN
ncbi:hypothetical protein MM26B8_00140 [Mycoplasmopsis meleagridis]|uniref:Lipoprotein n=1 Tax=Mycoplasmopsis meleagridis ATCC 25294 TaxID=1264554 RepID=A0A0F5H1X5_9BACT|nr:hypothetical protein [Mycoplasmopsis meleagridis]KKB26837.1 hypothetical protein MMELEA_05200 [Mycoplasmopsis meleagridis ATCC 25294]OAD18572.1 hypothetical protein MM26B8_00140 [Mycoplasmopsis meleagridis]VEU77424.1 Uncharacterised protein [Mycoplasmopsis meleagridis]